MQDKKMINALQGKVQKTFPFWLMRQAGRYLPEYRELRATAGSFLDLCFTPTLAAEVTLQPVRRFDMDAAILFSDILVIPHALGRKVEFREGEGPHLDRVLTINDIQNLAYDNRKLEPVYETLTRVKAELLPEKTLIGFAGAPFTVACYMIDGKGGGFPQTREWVTTRKDDLVLLIDKLADATIAYLLKQIEHGADTVQLFDSWAAIPKDADFDDLVIRPAKRIVAAIHAKYPNVPVIGFPRGAAHRYTDYAAATGIAGMGIDQSTRLEDVHTKTTLQGNLDPEALLEGGARLERETMKILNAMKGRPFVFNLGHGVIKETPPDHVGQLAKLIHGFDAS